VVDAEDLLLLECLRQLRIKLASRLKVVAQGLLDHYAPAGIALRGEAGLAQAADDVAESLGWSGKVEDHAAGPREELFQPRISCFRPVVQLHPFGRRGQTRAPASVLDDVPEAGFRLRCAADADHPQGHPVFRREPFQRGKDLALSEVA